MIKLDPEDKKLWLDGLRNSDKATGCLKSQIGMCCLGVLADKVLIPIKPELVDWQEDSLYYFDKPHDYYETELLGESLRLHFPKIEKVLSQSINREFITDEENEFLRNQSLLEYIEFSITLEDILIIFNDRADTFESIIEFIERFL